MTLVKKYRKYATGGGMGGLDPISLGIQGTELRNGIIDKLMPANEYGNSSPLAGALKGGLFGYLSANKQKQVDDQRRFHEGLQMRQNEMNRSAAIIGNNPALVTGRPGEQFYASGGFLKSQYSNVKATGGSITPMSSDSAEVQGPSHEQGGVDLPQFNSELEGGESIQDDYVFSERLGFAQRHKKLAKAIGKIEKKPTTPDRVNALNALNGQVQNLQQLQEQIRQQYNLQ